MMDDALIDTLAQITCKIMDDLSIMIHDEQDPPEKKGEHFRWYFDRQAQLGKRVIFSWRESHRWRDDPSYNSGLEHFEMVEFTSEEAAGMFDLAQSREWEGADTWENAEAWLKRG